jgi:hypothetical protein
MNHGGTEGTEKSNRRTAAEKSRTACTRQPFILSIALSVQLDPALPEATGFVLHHNATETTKVQSRLFA